MSSRRHFTDAQKAEAVAASLTLGVTEAAKRRGVNRSALSEWRRHPKFRHLLEEGQGDLGQQFRDAVDVALTSVLEALRDGKSNLGHRARALEVLTTSWQLVTGQATERVESASLNFNANWTPPAGAEPILTSSELKVLDRYLEALDKGHAPVIDVTPVTDASYQMVTGPEAPQASEMASDTAPALIAAPGPSYEPTVTLGEDA